jgi:hypothetical protein
LSVHLPVTLGFDFGILIRFISLSHLGLHGVKSCHCPIRLSHKTVDSLIGKLRALFQSAGRQGDWNIALGLGNPAASLEVKQYLKAFTSEQLQASVTPQQATPLFVNKLLLLSRPIQRKMGVPDVAAVSLFTLARDHAFFQTLFFSSLRTGSQAELRACIDD